MATTSPDNIRTPDSGDSYALVQDMGILADTVQNALIKRANAYVGTVAQRNANIDLPIGTIWSDEDGDRLVWKMGGSGWEEVSPTPNIPKIASGSHTFTNISAGTTQEVQISFPQGRFTIPPTVVVSSGTGANSTTTVNIWVPDGVTTSQFTLRLQKSSTTNQIVRWIAVQDQ